MQVGKGSNELPLPPETLQSLLDHCLICEKRAWRVGLVSSADIYVLTGGFLVGEYPVIQRVEGKIGVGVVCRLWLVKVEVMEDVFFQEFHVPLFRKNDLFLPEL